MHRHDQNLILAVVENSLDAAAAAAARADIASCAECSRELQIQEFARTALHAAPAVNLTELESARLRRSLRQQLGITTQWEPTKRARRRMPIAAFATAAAVLVAVVAVAPALNLIGGGDADSADMTSIVADAAATTAAPDEGGGELAPNALTRTEEHSLTAEAPALTTTGAPVPTAAGGSELLAYYADAPNLDTLRFSFRDDGYDEGLARMFALDQATDSIEWADDGSADACLAVMLSMGDEFVAGFEFARGNLDGRDVIFLALLAEDPEESAVVVVAVDNCEELGRAGP